MTQKTVKFTAQERLDLIDANAFQSLVYDYADESLGMIMGQAEGCLTPFSAVFSTAGPNFLVTLSAFTYLTSYENLTRANALLTTIPASWKAVAAEFNPAEESTEVIDYTAVRTAAVSDYTSGNPNTDDNGRTITGGYEGANRFPTDPTAISFLWAAVTAVDEDSDVRRRWDLPSGTEVSTTSNRRTAARTSFQWAATRPAAGWVAVAKIVGWYEATGVLTVPVLRPLFAWDTPAIYGAWTTEKPYEDSNRFGFNHLESGLLDLGVSPFLATAQLGLAHVLFLLRKAVFESRFQGSDDLPAEDHWLDTPEHSLKGLQAVTPKCLLRVQRDSSTTVCNVTFQATGHNEISFTKDAGPASDHNLDITGADLTAAGVSAAGLALWNATDLAVSAFTKEGVAIAPGGTVSVANQVFSRNEVVGTWRVTSVFQSSTGAQLTPGATGWSPMASCAFYSMTLALW